MLRQRRPRGWSYRKDKYMTFEVGNILQLKKKHPCGSDQWEVLRVGADFKLKCCGCGHEVMVRRAMVEKSLKKLSKKACN